MMPCVQCNTELVAPERSEYWSDRHACHIWLCPTCSACFESLVSFPTDSESMGGSPQTWRLSRVVAPSELSPAPRVHLSSF
jgi:hypothetical protein